MDQNFFSNLADRAVKNTKTIAIGLGAIVLILVSIGAVLHYRSKLESEARDKVFIAQNELENALNAQEKKEVKLDHFAEEIKKLKNVLDEHHGTAAATEGSLYLGKLYLNREMYEDAKTLFEDAMKSASGQDKIFSVLALGSVLENLGKFQEAIDLYQTHLNDADGPQKGDLLLGVARSYERLKNPDLAKSTYQKIISELSNSPYEKKAKVYLSTL